jgi:hypothetical protein
MMGYHWRYKYWMTTDAAEALLSSGLVLEVVELVEKHPKHIVYWCYLQQAASKETTASMIVEQITI